MNPQPNLVSDRTHRGSPAAVEEWAQPRHGCSPGRARPSSPPLPGSCGGGRGDRLARMPGGRCGLGWRHGDGRARSLTGAMMVEPYNAVGLIPTFWGIRGRADMEHNFEHIESLTKAAFWLSSLDIPVRLLAIPEGALQG